MRVGQRWWSPRRLALWSATCLALWLAGALPAQADTVKLLTAGAFKQVVLALQPGFEAGTGHRVEVVNDTAGALVQRIAAGEAFDALVLPPAALQPLADNGTVAPASVVLLATVGIGVAVKTGAPLPAVATVEQFRAALLAARRVAYIDPASGGSSGVYLERLFERLGIADAVRAKAVRVAGGLVAQRLVTGEADLALHQISEILPVAGTTLVAPLPAELQHLTTYAGAVAANGPRDAAAKALLAWLAGPQAAEALRAVGMVPAAR